MTLLPSRLTNQVSSEQVEAFKEMVEAHARRFARIPDLASHFDDLAQVGLIAVWEALRDGHRPSNIVVTNAMRDYGRVERRKGFTGYNPNEDILELVALEELEASG